MLPGAGRLAIRTTQHAYRVEPGNGSGAAISANLAYLRHLRADRRASCKGPASRNGIASILTTKGVLGDGGITSDNSGDRAGIHCKTNQGCRYRPRCNQGLQVRRYLQRYSQGESFLRSRIPASWCPTPRWPKCRSECMRVGIVREFMGEVDSRTTKRSATSSTRRSKKWWAGKLGATLVQSVDPDYPDDPSFCQK